MSIKTPSDLYEQRRDINYHGEFPHYSYNEFGKTDVPKLNKLLVNLESDDWRARIESLNNTYYVFLYEIHSGIKRIGVTYNKNSIKKYPTPIYDHAMVAFYLLVENTRLLNWVLPGSTFRYITTEYHSGSNEHKFQIFNPKKEEKCDSEEWVTAPIDTRGKLTKSATKK